jgi:DNA polymerase elongation subunit (family B)
MDRRTVIPVKDNQRQDTPQIAGGFVKEPIIGMHNYVMSFDLNSLYPHLIMQYSIGPDTHVSRTELINMYNSVKDKDLSDSIQKALGDIVYYYSG